MIKSHWAESLKEASLLLERFRSDSELMSKCDQFTQIVIDCISEGGTLFSCGNGGSHCDALHFAEEWTGRYRKNRRPVAALALGEASHSSCVGNDYGFEFIFERQIQALGRPGDVLLALSTSGNSKNVARACQAAKAKGLKTVALLGKDGGVIKNLVDLSIVVPAQTTDRIQEMHIKLIHNVIEGAERALFPENYK